jgi:hypothetical protein
MVGRASAFSHGSPNKNTNHQLYIGVYGQDAWRLSDRLTANIGLRWDPYLGTVWDRGTISNFSLGELQGGHPQHQLPERPARTAVPGRQGVPRGQVRHEQAVRQRVAARGSRLGRQGRQPHGHRSSYALNYDFPGGAFQQPAANVPPSTTASR